MYFIDTAYNSLIKYGEELCGDHVEQILLEDCKILVLSDGLGSGVKANILATLTSKIVVTMLKEGATLEETIDTIVHTLPVCQERQLAYSTFTILKVYKDGTVYAAEFDNPSFFLYRNGQDVPVKKTLKIINQKKIYESHFRLDKESLLVVVSDGVIHAGVGVVLNLGWEWDNVNAYLRELSKAGKSAGTVAANLIEVCQNLYEDRAGDDTTVLAVKIREQETINLLTGPPQNMEYDKQTIEKIMNTEGSFVVCGGTTANVVSRILNKEIQIDMSTMTEELPPAAFIEGTRLVTEGVITINKTLDILKACLASGFHPKAVARIHQKNAASMLAKILLEDCDRLNIWMGQAINPAHQDDGFTMNFSFKITQINALKSLMEKLGKDVRLYYV